MPRSGHGHFNGLPEKCKDVSALTPQNPKSDATNHESFGYRFDEFNQPTPGNEARQALDRIKAPKIGIKRLQREIPAAQKER